MPSPVVYTDIPIYNAQSQVCDKLELLLRTSDRFRDFLQYAFDVAGNVSTEFADDIAEALGSLIGVPVGAVIWRPASEVPSGYVLANGQSLSRADYPELFLVYGTNFGADSSLTFKVPNLYDRVQIGGGSTYSIGAIGGSATHVLTLAELPSALTIPRQFTAIGGGQPFLQHDASDEGDVGVNRDTDDDDVPGTSTPHNNLQPYMAGLFLVKT